MGERLTAEREAEIRAACDVVSWTVDTLRDRRDLLAEIDALRGDVADLQREHADRDDGDEVANDEIAARSAERDEARRERDELAAKLDEREGDMHARIRAEYDRTIADTWRAANARMADERDELAAKLAALRAEVHDVLAEPHAYIGGRERSVLTCAVAAAAAPAVEAYTRRVQAEALESAATDLESWCDPYDADAIAELRRRAAYLRGGR